MVLPSKVHCLSCLLIVGGLTLLAFSNNTTAEDVPLSKLSQNIGAPTLKFLYWYDRNLIKIFIVSY